VLDEPEERVDGHGDERRPVVEQAGLAVLGERGVPRRRRRRSREDRGADLVGEVRGSGEPPSESGDVPDQPERDRDVGGEDADRDERRDAREPRGHLSEQGDEFGGDRLHYRPYSVGDLMRIGRRELAGRLPAADAPRGAYGTPAERPIMAPAEDDISIEEKRVYAGTAGRTDAYVATESGVVRVALSADKIGAFDMVAREPARDAAVLPRRDAPDLLGVATPDGLQVAPVGDDLAFEPVDVDPVGSKSLVAVGVHDDAFLVAGEDGEINGIEFGDEESDPTATSIGTVSDPRAVDGPRRGRGRGLSSLRRRFRTRLGRPRRRPRRGRIRNAPRGDRRGRLLAGQRLDDGAGGRRDRSRRRR